MFVALSAMLLTAPPMPGQEVSRNEEKAGTAVPDGTSGKDSLALKLEEVFGMIESGNNTLKMLRTATQAAEEGVRTAKNAMLPDLDASVSVSYNGDAFLSDRDFSNITRAETPHFGNGFTIDATQVVYAGGVLKAGVEMADLNLKRSNVQLDQTRQSLRLVAAGQYLDLYRIGNSIKVYEENISLTEKLISDIEARRQQGLALADDVTRYELQLQTLKLELDRLRSTADVMNYRLCESLGLPEGTVVIPSLPDAAEYEYSGITDWQEVAYRSAPSSALAQVASDEAQARRTIVKGEMLPSVAVVAHDNMNGPITFEIPPVNKNINIWYVGLGINYSFGSLYKSRGKVRQANFAARQAQEAVDVARQNVREEVKQAYSDWQLAFTELRTRQKSLQLATENYDRVYFRYMEQLALVTDMLDAFNMKLSAEIGVSDAEAEIRYRQCRLAYAAGIL
jgi:outer membrane protein